MRSDQLERAQPAAREPVAMLHEERVQLLRSVPARLSASISWFGSKPRLTFGTGEVGVYSARSTSISPGPPGR